MATNPNAKLTNVEAQRILAILEEMYSKIELLSRVPPLRRVPGFDQFQDIVGPEVAQVLDEQVLLEQQYKWVSTPQHEQTGEGGFEGDQTLPDFETLDDELRHSTRVVCRMLHEAPVISEHLKGMDEQGASAHVRKFLSTSAELKSQTFRKLSTSVEEEKSREDWFLEISAREEKASQTLRQLQKEIKAEKAERERQVSTRNETIQKLREELDLIKTSTLAEEKQLDAETKASEEADRSSFGAKETALTQEFNKLTEDLKKQCKENKEAEELLRNKKKKYEKEAAEWISKYDADMDEKFREIEALKLIYEEEKKELTRLETYFSKLQQEREEVLAQERKKAEERARAQAQMATLSKAATMLQKMWRGKCARRDIGKKAGGGKKGKKKK